MSQDNQPVRIGVAGYMGAGKSTCAALCAEMRGMRIVDADAEAKLLMENDTRIRDELALAFGPRVAGREAVDFSALGSVAFSTTGDMQKLNRIVHPPLVRRLRDLVLSRPGPCILDAALIPLWSIDDWFDCLLWVRASPRVRLKRVCERTGLPEDRVRQRMHVQEALMSEPSGPNWTFVNNEGMRDDLASLLDKNVCSRL
jgi:dephospho-CoA kinase